MRKYSAIVKDGKRTVFIRNEEYNTKAEFIYDLRKNGYSVNPRKVKRAEVFDYICEKTNMAPEDWGIRKVPGSEERTGKAVTDYEERIRQAMIEYGAIGEKWRISVTGMERERPGSDRGTVTVEVTRPRHRKPSLIWELAIWIPGNLLDWNKSQFHEL